MSASSTSVGLGERLAVGDLEDGQVGVAEHGRPAERGDQVERLGRLAAALDEVAAEEDLVDGLRAQVGQDGLEGGQGAVGVGDDGQAEADSVTPDLRTG